MSYQTITKESGSVPSNEGLPIHYDLYIPNGGNDKSHPVILFLHGFKRSEEWCTFPAVC